MKRQDILKRFILDIWPTTKTLVEPMMKYLIIIEVSKEINTSITNFGEKIDNSKEELQRSALYFFEGLLILLALLATFKNTTPASYSLGQELANSVLGDEGRALLFLFSVLSWPYAAHYASCLIKNKFIQPYASISTAMYWWGFIFSVATLLLLLFVLISYAIGSDLDLIKTEPYNYVVGIIGFIYALLVYMFLIRHIFNFPIWFSTVNNLGFFSLLVALLGGLLLSYFILIPVGVLSGIISEVFQFL